MFSYLCCLNLTLYYHKFSFEIFIVDDFKCIFIHNFNRLVTQGSRSHFDEAHDYLKSIPKLVVRKTQLESYLARKVRSFFQWLYIYTPHLLDNGIRMNMLFGKETSRLFLTSVDYQLMRFISSFLS